MNTERRNFVLRLIVSRYYDHQAICYNQDTNWLYTKWGVTLAVCQTVLQIFCVVLRVCWEGYENNGGNSQGMPTTLVEV